MKRRSGEILIAKFGNKCVVNGNSIDQRRVNGHARRYAKLLDKYRLGIVASGSRGAGRRKIRNFNKALLNVLDERTLTAAGGASAYHTWEIGFGHNGILTVELKATHDNMDHPEEGKSLVDVFLECVDYGIVPVFNINDPLDRHKDELGRIKEGRDNDFAAEHLSRKVGADTLMLLTAKVGGVLIDGEVQPKISIGDLDELESHFTETDEEGTGSMRGKVQAAASALEGGVDRVYIGSSGADPREIIAGHKGTQVVQ